MDFAKRLNELIDEAGLNSLRLSKEIGVADRLIGAWRKSEKRPTLDNIVLLAGFFGVSLDYLVGNTDVREVETKKEPPLVCSEEAAALGTRYDALDDDGKAVVRCSIITEERRLSDKKEVCVQSPSEWKAV